MGAEDRIDQLVQLSGIRDLPQPARFDDPIGVPLACPHGIEDFLREARGQRSVCDPAQQARSLLPLFR